MFSNILSGSATTNGATIITIPPNSKWIGQITVSGTVVVPSGGASVSASARISISGTGSIPASGDYLTVNLQAPTSMSLAIGTSDSGTIGAPIIIYSTTDPVLVVLNTTNTTSQSGSAIGEVVTL